MHEYDGTGLAAPQVHSSLRVAVLSLDGDRDPEFFVNPVITALTDETSSMMEGCLSVEGMRGRVWRPNHIKIEALDRHGNAKAYELTGFPAIVVQHECDHLDGVLYVDRCEPKTLAFIKEYRRYGPVDEWLEEQENEGSEVTESLTVPEGRELDEDTDELRRLLDDPTEAVVRRSP